MQPSAPIFALIACLCGVYTLGAAWLDWDWFFENYKARLFVKWWGRQGARVFYGVLGVWLLVMGGRFFLL